jgi:hypothetical protein
MESVMAKLWHDLESKQLVEEQLEYELSGEQSRRGCCRCWSSIRVAINRTIGRRGQSVDISDQTILFNSNDSQ